MPKEITYHAHSTLRCGEGADIKDAGCVRAIIIFLLKFEKNERIRNENICVFN
jgi:hypothetical protein